MQSSETDFTFEKMQDGGWRYILKFGVIAIAQSLWLIFEPSFAQGHNIIFHGQIRRQNLLHTKSKMVAISTTVNTLQ